MNLKSNFNIIYVAIAVIFISTGLAFGDVLELEDGRIVVGNYVDGTADFILFEVDGDVLTFPVGDVKSMGLSDAEPAADAANQLVVVPVGTRLLIRTIETVDSRRHKAGHMFSARLEGDLKVGSVLVAPRGAKVYGRITDSRRGGNVAGKAQLSLQLSDITVNGKPYQIATSAYKEVTQGEGRQTARRSLGAAAIGGLIDGKSGARTGAKIGAGVSIVTRGEQINIPSGTVLEFTLQGDLVIR